MKKIVLLLMALLLSAVSFGQINVSPTTFHNGIKLPNVTVKNTDSLATINGNGEIHYVSKNDVDSWILKVDGVNKKELKLGQALDIIAGDNVTLSYSNGTVTISAGGKEYTAGSGLTLIGSEFNADFGTTVGTVTEGNDARVAHGEAAYLWGDHSTQGYLTSYTETDPVYSASTAGSITGTDVANWNASEPNVQSDWNATSGDAEVLNKPVIPIKTSDLINDGSDGTSAYVEQSEIGYGLSLYEGKVVSGFVKDTIISNEPDAHVYYYPNEDALMKWKYYTKSSGSSTVIGAKLIGKNFYGNGEKAEIGIKDTPYNGTVVKMVSETIDGTSSIYLGRDLGGSSISSSGIMLTSDMNIELDSDIVNATGEIAANSFRTYTGTANQFLKADGSIDSNVYLTSFNELDPVYSASTASGITAADVANWDGKAEIADIPTDNTQLANGAGYLTTSAFDLIDVTQQVYTDKAIVVPAFNNTGMTYSEGSIDLGLTRDSIHEMGFYAFKAGIESQASGTATFAVGYMPTASGNYSVAIGNRASALSTGAVAIGINAKASKQGNVAISGIATGTNATAIGGEASGTSSVSIGTSSKAEGVSSLAMLSSEAIGRRAIAIGHYLKAEGMGQVALGSWNTRADSKGGGITNPPKGGRLFVLGNGTNATQSDAILVNWRGEIYAPSMTVEMIAAPHLETDDSHYATVPESNGKILVTKEYLMYWLKHLPSYDATKTQVLTNTSGTIGWTLK